MLRRSLDPSKLMDPRKVLMRRYHMMGLHFGIIVALILVSALEVRSAILLGINGFSCALFLTYVPTAAVLSWRRSRTGSKVRDLARAPAGTKWDCGAIEVGYLGVQCSTTLVSGILCAYSLNSQECFGRGTWSLDEFATIKERDVDNWCEGVIGVTVLSFAQLGLDLIWLGWVVYLVRSAGDVVDPLHGGARDALSPPQSPRLRGGSPSSSPDASPVAARSTSATLRLDPPTHAQKILAALHTPVPLILLKLAAHRSEKETLRLERLASATRERRRSARRMYAGRRRAGAGLGTGAGVEDVEAGEDGVMDVEAGGEEVPPPYGAERATRYPSAQGGDAASGPPAGGGELGLGGVGNHDHRGGGGEQDYGHAVMSRDPARQPLGAHPYGHSASSAPATHEPGVMWVPVDQNGAVVGLPSPHSPLSPRMAMGMGVGVGPQAGMNVSGGHPR